METQQLSQESLTTLASSLHGLETEEQVSLFIDELIRHAAHWGASDIHIEPTRNSVWVRLRLDGVLQELGHFKRVLSPNFIARIKVLAELLTYRTDIPQDGCIREERIAHLLQEPGVELRISIVPVVNGEKAVLRILYVTRQHFNLNALGFPPKILDALYPILKSPQGVVLFTGPAGSGKTTSIYAALACLTGTPAGTRNIVTIEDPVESLVEGITQTQVNLAVGFTFSNALRSLLRQDPEVIMVGEIRDKETAQIAIQAGLTGHFVISTVHSGRAAGVFTRLLEIGIEPYLLQSAVRVVIAQRLLRLLCPSCKQPVKAFQHPQLLTDKTYQAGKCPACRSTGYRGRQLIAECLIMSPQLQSGISPHCHESTLEEIACKSGMQPLPQTAWEMVNAGQTSLAEVERVLSLG